MPVVERHGVRLYYTDSGSGPAVLFHAGGGGDGRMWECAGYTAAFALLANGSAVVLSGFGHLQTFWHSEKTAPLIVDFLQAQGIVPI